MASVNEILDQAAGAEERLEERLGTLRDGSPDGGVRLLTYNLRRRCSRLRQALEKLYPGERDTAANVAYSGRHQVDPGPAEHLASVETESVTSAELLLVALEHSRAMASLYGELIQHDLPGDLADALQALREREQKDAGILQKMLETRYPESPALRT